MLNHYFIVDTSREYELYACTLKRGSIIINAEELLSREDVELLYITVDTNNKHKFLIINKDTVDLHYSDLKFDTFLGNTHIKIIIHTISSDNRNYIAEITEDIYLDVKNRQFMIHEIVEDKEKVYVERKIEDAVDPDSAMRNDPKYVEMFLTELEKSKLKKEECTVGVIFQRAERKYKKNKEKENVKCSK
jgi:hypothetical protein